MNKKIENIDDNINNLAEKLDNLDFLNEDEINELISDDISQDTIKDIDNFCQVILENRKMEKPDVMQEWNKFYSKKINSKKVKIKLKWNQIYSALTGVAAVLIIIIFVRNFIFTDKNISDKKNINIYTAVESPRNVVVVTEDGIAHSLNDSIIKNTLSVNENLKELSYKETNISNEKIILHTLITPKGEDFKLILDDGSEVWINSGSKLTYPVKFSEKERVITLEGEAYFKIAQDSSRKFIVICNDLRTEVLGTEFNVRNYTVYDTQITLVTGKVEVSTNDGIEKIVLQPGYNAHLSESGIWEVKEVDTDIYTMWHNGYLYFDNETIASVMKKIGEWYNLNVEFTDAEALNYHIRFLANRKEPIINAISLLNSLEKVQVTLVENTIIVSASK